MTALNRPLTDAEYDRLGSMLAHSERAMNLEMVDGFFAALICGPETVPPSEYLRLIWGGDPASAARRGGGTKRRCRSSSISSCGTGTLSQAP